MNSFLNDERGSRSSARLLLVCVLVFTAVLIVLDSLWWDVPDPAYVLLGTFGTGLLAWAGGSRIAQYVGPQIGAVAAGIAAAAGRTKGTYQRPADVVTDGSGDFESEGDEP